MAVLTMLALITALSGTEPTASADEPVYLPHCDPAMEVCDVLDPATGRVRVWPKDVDRFQDNVEGCIHFAGEEPYDAARRRQIDSALRSTCGGAKRAIAPLRKKYAKNPPVLDRVNAIQALMESAF